jgi:uncharacterized protein
MNTLAGRELYSKNMCRNLKRVFVRQYHMMKDHPKVNWDALRKSKQIWGTTYLNETKIEFDDACTAPLFGYSSVWEYYNAASCTHQIPNIKTPMLALHSLDDPIACKL